MIIIRVLSSDVREISGTSQKNKPYSFKIQTAYAFVLDRETNKAVEIPEKIEVMLEKDQAPYTRGDYTISPASLYVDRNGRLTVSPQLDKVPSKTA